MTGTANHGQSRLMSLAEAIANVVVGYGVAVLTQIAVFSIFELRTSLSVNLLIGGVFTIVSLGRCTPAPGLRGDTGAGRTNNNRRAVSPAAPRAATQLGRAEEAQSTMR